MYTFAKTTGLTFISLALMFGSCSSRENKVEKSAVFRGEPSIVEISIEGMTCTGCEQTIQKSVGKVEGVRTVSADFKKGTALVEYFPAMTDTSALRKAVTGSGYAVKKFNSPPSGETSE